MKQILYRKEPLAAPEYHPEVLKNSMTKEDVAKVQASVQKKAEEAKAAQMEASQTWRDRIASLMLSRTLELDRDRGDLTCWFSGQRFSDVGSIRAHFGKNMEYLTRVGPRYVTEEDISELARIVGNIRRRYWATRVANKFLQLEENKDAGRVIVGWKLGRNYVLASVHEICRSGSVAISGRGRNIGKVHAIVQLCLGVWPELTKLAEQNGSESVNGQYLKNVEIRLALRNTSSSLLALAKKHAGV